MDEVITQYICSECGQIVSSEGTEASDHMFSQHGIDPDGGRVEGAPYLVPVDANPTLNEEGVPEV